jgi:hypothetical protein
VIEDDLGLKALAMPLETLHQLGPLHPFRIGRPVVDVGCRHQLSTLRDAGDQRGPEVGAGGVDGGSVAGGTRS